MGTGILDAMSFHQVGPRQLPAARGWYPDALGVVRWWDGTRWTQYVAGPTVAYPGAAGYAPVPPSRGSRAAVWIAGGLAVLLLLALVGLGVFGAVREIERENLETGTPGYYTAQGSHGLPLLVGAPWGEPCAPVVVTVGEEFPQVAYDALVEVVEEARDGGLPITVAHPTFGTWDPSDHMFSDATPRFVNVSGGSPEPQRSDKPDTRFHVKPETELMPGGGNEVLTSISETFYVSKISTDAREYRQLMRRLVGFSSGVYDADDSLSALKNRNPSPPDAFTESDMAAMQAMSGCGGPQVDTGEVSV